MTTLGLYVIHTNDAHLFSKLYVHTLLKAQEFESVYF